MTLGQGQEMTLTFNTHISSLSQLVLGHTLQKFWKIRSFHFYYREAYVTKFDLAIK